MSPQVARGIGLDPRIGREFLAAGIGFGGYCFPKDLRAFMHLAREHRVDCGLLQEVENINLRRADVFLKKVRQAVWVLQGKKLACWAWPSKKEQTTFASLHRYALSKRFWRKVRESASA